MSDNEAIVLIVTVVAMTSAVRHFLDFITKMAEMGASDSSEPKESAWDDEL